MVACIRWLGPLVYVAAAKDAMICPTADIRGVLDTSFTRVSADAENKVPTGYGFWVNEWPAEPGWKFVAVGIGLFAIGLALSAAASTQYRHDLPD